MINQLFWTALGGAVLFSILGIFIIWASIKHKSTSIKVGLFLMTLLGPATLGVCWNLQVLFMENDGVLWGRLMSGDASTTWAIGSLGLIVGSGLSLGALSLFNRFTGVFFSAAAFALVWIVLYLHPTPHYVPMPPWADKLVWFAILAGGAGGCVYLHLKLQPYLTFLQYPATFAAGLVSLLSLANGVAYFQVDRPIDLASLDPSARIKDMGCLSCHSMGEVGYPIPGGGLESVASRSEDAVLAFLLSPDAEKAKQYGIRENPTGQMAGVRLSEEEASLLTEALAQLFEVKPPSKLGPGWDHIEMILTEKTCLACHTLQGEGAPDGGIGGPLEAASEYELDVLVQWLMEPTAENAVRFKLREIATGAMTTFALPEDQATEMARWLKSLENGEP